MNLETIDWSLWRSFLAIAREGSLSGAARALAVAQPTVRRHLEILETALGGALFVRSPSGLAPTEMALGLRGSAEAMEAAALFLVRTASAGAATMAGTVRITASEIVGTEILPAILAGISRLHPGLAFEVAITNRTENLLRHDADLAIRMAKPVQGELVARKAADLPVGLYAHRRWFDGREEPADIAALVAERCLIGHDKETAILRGFAARGIAMTRTALRFRSDSDLAQWAAIRSGLGVGFCQVALAARDPDLRRLLPHLEFAMEAWVVVHPDLRDNRRVRATFDALLDGLKRYADAGSGA